MLVILPLPLITRTNKFQSSNWEGLLQTFPSCSFKQLALPCQACSPVSLIADKTWKALLTLGAWT